MSNVKDSLRNKEKGEYFLVIKNEQNPNVWTYMGLKFILYILQLVSLSQIKYEKCCKKPLGQNFSI